MLTKLGHVGPILGLDVVRSFVQPFHEQLAEPGEKLIQILFVRNVKSVFHRILDYVDAQGFGLV